MASAMCVAWQNPFYLSGFHCPRVGTISPPPRGCSRRAEAGKRGRKVSGSSCPCNAGLLSFPCSLHCPCGHKITFEVMSICLSLPRACSRARPVRMGTLAPQGCGDSSTCGLGVTPLQGPPIRLEREWCRELGLPPASLLNWHFPPPRLASRVTFFTERTHTSWTPLSLHGRPGGFNT